MKLPRRSFLHLAAGAAALPALSRVAKAQSHPTRPVSGITLGDVLRRPKRHPAIPKEETLAFDPGAGADYASLIGKRRLARLLSHLSHPAQT